MKKYLLILLAAAMVATALIAPADARDKRAAQQTTSGYSVTVVFLREPAMTSRFDGDGAPLMYRLPSQQTIAKAQAELQSDSYLRSVLRAKQIQLRFVVGVQTAFNGGKVVYVR